MSRTINITEFANRPTTRNLADWFDFAEANGIQPTPLPYEVAEAVFGANPDERVYEYFLNPCGNHCGGFHPHSVVDRYRDWFWAHGQDRRAGIHTSGMEWRFVTRDREAAICEAKLHLDIPADSPVPKVGKRPLKNTESC